MVAAFATPQDVLDAPETELRLVATVGGVVTDCVAYEGQHDVDQATATARLELTLPRPAHVRANAEVVVQAGWNNYVTTRFWGRIPAWNAALDAQGERLVIRPVGWTSLLSYADRFDLVFNGPISIRDLFVALCRRRRVPAYIADRVTDPTGTIEIRLGGNKAIDDGKVIIRAGTDPLRFLNSACEPFGFRVYDTNAGQVRLSRISGRPVGASVVTFTERQDLAAVARDYDISGKVNYHDVQGPQYEDAQGAIIPIRSIAAGVPYDPDLAPEGFRYRKTSNSLLVTQQLADIARNVLEIDTGAAQTPVTWSAVALPGLSVGDVVTVDAPTVEAGGPVWLTRLDETIDVDDYGATYRGWAGGGTALPHGQDRQTIPLQTAPVHLGDEYVSWYAQPNHQGREKSWTFTIPERATAVTVRFWHHGTNSQLVDGGAKDDLNVSRYELWRAGADKAESSGTIAPAAENYERQLPYRDGLTHWTPGAVSLRGTDAGQVTLWLKAGESAGFDDFEVQGVVVEIYGASEPALPRERS